MLHLFQPLLKIYITFDVHVEERFQINEKIGHNLIEENEELKQRVLYLETQLDILLKRFNRLTLGGI